MLNNLCSHNRKNHFNCWRQKADKVGFNGNSYRVSVGDKAASFHDFDVSTKIDFVAKLVFSTPAVLAGAKKAAFNSIMNLRHIKRSRRRNIYVCVVKSRRKSFPHCIDKKGWCIQQSTRDLHARLSAQLCSFNFIFIQVSAGVSSPFF